MGVYKVFPSPWGLRVASHSFGLRLGVNNKVLSVSSRGEAAFAKFWSDSALADASEGASPSGEHGRHMRGCA